jgi:hypothetical protein
MKTTPLWMRCPKTVENSRRGRFPMRKHRIFRGFLARGDGPVFTKGTRFEDARLLGT